MHPSTGVEREYVARVEGGAVDAAALEATLARGVEMIERTPRGAEAVVVCGRLVSVDEQSVRLCVTEGKHRMVRRMLAACGHPVSALHRMRYGAVRLDELAIAEGDAAPIEGKAMEWAMELR